MTEGEKYVTVEVSIELLAQLEREWSPPVQIQIERTARGYEMTARTHTCEPCPLSDLDNRCAQFGDDA